MSSKPHSAESPEPFHVPRDAERAIEDELKLGVSPDVLEDIGLLPSDTNTGVVGDKRRTQHFDIIRRTLGAMPVQTDVIIGDPERERRVRIVRDRQREERKAS